MADAGKIIALAKAAAKISDEQVQSAVSEWLDDHPEATTTVEDGAISYAKLDSSLKGTVDDVDELKSALDDLTSEYDIRQTWLTGEGRTTGVVLDDGTASTQGAYANWKYDSISITSDHIGKKLHVVGYSWYAIQPYVFKNSSNVVSTPGAPNPGNVVTKHEYELTITETGTFYVNGSPSNKIGVFEETYVKPKATPSYVENNFKQDKPTNQTTVSVTWEASQILNVNGVKTQMQVTDNAYGTTNYISVNEGEKYRIVAKLNYLNCFFAFYDNNYEVVYKRETGSTSSEYVYIDEIVSVPIGAKYLVVSNYWTGHDYTTDSSDNVFKVTAVDVDLKQYTNVINQAQSVDAGKLWTSTDTGADWRTINNLSGIWESINGTELSGKILSGDGSIIDYENGKVLVVSAKPNTNYKYSSCAWGQNYDISFFDSNMNVVGGHYESGSSTWVTHTDESITSPANTAYAAVTTKGSDPYGIKEVNAYAVMPWVGKKWVVIGDSHTEHNIRATKNYHDYVAEEKGITVVNMGLSGTGYKRTEDNNNAFYQRILNVPNDADVVTIYGSGNDLSYTLGDVTDTGTTTLCGCINKTIDNYYSVLPTTPIGIITPCPWGSYNPNNDSNAMALYSAAIVEICRRRGIPCLDLYHCSGMRPWDDTFRSLIYTRDDGGSCHPDENGHAILAPHFSEFLEKMLL